MVSWTRQDAPAVFSRPLGLSELALYWEAAISGAGDSVQRVTVETSQPAQIFSEQNVKRTWLAIKTLHPLMGASIREDNLRSVHFVVDERRLSSLAPEEIVFTSLKSDQEVQELSDRIINEPRTLSNSLITRIWIISLPQRSGRPAVYHLFIHAAHCAYDGVAQSTLMRAFLDLLAYTHTPDQYLPKGDLESRLALLVPVEDLYPALKLSLPRQRWRIAIAKVIYLNRDASVKGGTTLFRKIAPQRYPAPAVSRTLRITMPKDVSKRIMNSCRKFRITFGQALPLLSQLAHARVLHRLRSQGKIPDDEWEYRIRQPMHMTGPLNLRPYLDKEWLDKGGADGCCVAISNYRLTLPFLPVSRSSPSEVEPGFDALLSKARFLYRCRGIRRQMIAYLNHPLLTELANILRPARIAKAQDAASKWRESQRGLTGQSQSSICSASKQDDTPQMNGEYVMANACSSFGKVDHTLPPNYPVDRSEFTAEAPSLRLVAAISDMRCVPAELFLTSMSYADQIQLVLLCDIGVYEESLAMQWLEEVSRAAAWYLGCDNAEPAKL